MKKFLKSPYFWTAVFFFLNLILIFFHEPWRDEANPWQIAKNLKLDQIYELIKYEGHPALWYLILSPFAKLGFPYITTNFISLVITTFAVFLFLNHSPFKRKTSILLIFTQAFFYFVPVISRNYCLVTLGMVFVMITYHNRLKSPLKYLCSLVFLLQSHFLVAGFVGTLSISYLIEHLKMTKSFKRTAKTLLFPGSLLFISLFLVLPFALEGIASNSVVVGRIGFVPDIESIINAVNSGLYGIPILVFEVTFTVFLIYILVRNRKIFLLFAGGMSFYAAVMIFMYYFSISPEHKSSIIVLFMIFALWQLQLEKDDPGRIAVFIKKTEIVKTLSWIFPTSIFAFLPIFLTIPHVIVAVQFDIENEYSYATRTANFINTLEDDAVILSAGPVDLAQAVAIEPLLKGNRYFYDLTYDEPYRYVRYTNKYNENVSDEEFLERMAHVESEHIYYFRLLDPSNSNPTNYDPPESWKVIFNLPALAVPAGERQLIIYSVQV